MYGAQCQRENRLNPTRRILRGSESTDESFRPRHTCTSKPSVTHLCPAPVHHTSS